MASGHEEWQRNLPRRVKCDEHCDGERPHVLRSPKVSEKDILRGQSLRHLS